MLDPGELGVAFAEELIRTVRPGGAVSVDSGWYRHDALLSRAGDKVILRRSYLHDDVVLSVFDEYGEFVGIAEREPVFRFDDVSGAQEQHRQARLHAKQMRAMEREAERIDAVDVMAERIAFAKPPAQAESDGVVSINPEFRKASGAAARLADHGGATPADPQDAQALAIAELARISRRKSAVGE